MFRNWSPAMKRYQGRVAVLMVLYIVVLFADVSWFKANAPQGAIKYPLALLPALPIIGVVASMGLYIAEEADEFQRKLMVERVLWGTGATLAVCTAWGFLQSFDVAPNIPLFYVAVLWFALFGAANIITWWRYR